MKSKEKQNFDVLFMADIETALSAFFEKGKDFTVYPKGNSMFPTLKEGEDSVVLSPILHIKKSGIYLYKRPNGEYALHRLLRFSENGFIFSGDNQLVFEKVKEEQLIAIVSQIHKNGKRYDTTLKYKIFLKANSVYFFRWLRVKFCKLKRRI